MASDSPPSKGAITAGKFCDAPRIARPVQAFLYGLVPFGVWRTVHGWCPHFVLQRARFISNRPLRSNNMDDPARQTSYFNYFTEIEERYLQRRGGGLLLSTLDWSLIETWKDAGIPLEAVLRGIDAAFDRYDQRPTKTKKINSLAYCSQTVLAAAEDMKEAAVGAGPGDSPKSRAAEGFEADKLAAFLQQNAEKLGRSEIPSSAGAAQQLVSEAAKTLRELAEQVAGRSTHRLEDLERRLTVIEEKLFAALLTSTPDEEIVDIRAEADRDLAPYRSKMSGPQIEQLQKQYVHKGLLEKYKLPRLSLFYM